MFNTIAFYFDTEGKFRGDVARRCVQPLELSAVHCNAEGFYVETGEHRGMFGDNWPSVLIKRALGPVETDPYNEDGSPPTVMCCLLAAHLSILDEIITIEFVISQQKERDSAANPMVR